MLPLFANTKKKKNKTRPAPHHPAAARARRALQPGGARSAAADVIREVRRRRPRCEGERNHSCVPSSAATSPRACLVTRARARHDATSSGRGRRASPGGWGLARSSFSRTNRCGLCFSRTNRRCFSRSFFWRALGGARGPLGDRVRHLAARGRGDRRGARSFFRSFLNSFVRSFFLTFVRSFVLSFLRSFVLSFLRSFFRSFFLTFVRSFFLTFVFPSRERGVEIG